MEFDQTEGHMIYSYLAFSNEIAGAVAMHPSAKSIYAHHPDGLVEHLLKYGIDTVALTSISMLAVHAYMEKEDEKDALATAIGTLLMAFVVPSVAMAPVVNVMCDKQCNPWVRVVMALAIVAALFALEHPARDAIRDIIEQLQPAQAEEDPVGQTVEEETEPGADEVADEVADEADPSDGQP